MSTDTMIQRLLSGKPRSIDEERRTCELLIATEAVVQGLRLVCEKSAITHAQIVPVLLSHKNDTSSMCGRIERLRFESGKVYGLARFDAAPAADEGWQLARAGCAVSVGAQLDESSIIDERDHATCRKWRLLEASLVAVGADPAACTRSLETVPMTTTATTPTVTVTDTTTSPEVADLRRQVQRLENEQMIRATADRAGVHGEVLDQIVERHGDDTAAACQEIVRVIAARQPRFNSLLVDPSGGAADDLSGLIGRKLKGERGLAPLSVILRDELRIAESNPTQIVQRAMATTDFPQALIEAGQRELLDAYNRADEGVRALALRRELMDFRQIKLMRVSKFGAVGLVPEGAEYATSTFSEEDGVPLQAAQYGSLMKVTRVALANDDLDVFGRMVIEMGGAAARREAEELALRLDDITWTAANSLTGQTSLDVDAIAAGVLLLRRQTDVNGNKVSFTPNTLIIAPEQEKVSRQMLASYQPNTAANVNPFSTLRLEVDHNLADGIAYLADTSYMPLAIGQVGVGPSISEEEEFTTGSLQLRVQHDFGTSAVDGRSVVRIAL